MFAGLMPYEIYDHYPDLWVFDEEEAGKNLHEKELFEKQLSSVWGRISDSGTRRSATSGPGKNSWKFSGSDELRSEYHHLQFC